MKTSVLFVVVLFAVFAGTLNAADLYWSGTDTWDTTTQNWGTTSGGSYDAATWNNATPDSAIFEGTAGTVTLGEAITAGGLTFDTAGYTITGNTLTLGNASTPIAVNQDATISSVIAGDNTLVKSGARRLTLSGNNTYTGGTTITLGHVMVRSDTAFGTGTVTLEHSDSSSTFIRVNLFDVTLDNDFVLNSNAATGDWGVINAGSGNALSTINGDITIQNDPLDGGHFSSVDGTLRLMGAINVENDIAPVFRSGIVEVGGGGNYTALNHQEGTLRLLADNALSTTAALDAALSGNTTLDLNGFNQSLSGLSHSANDAARNINITGNGTLTVNATSDTELGPGGTRTAGNAISAARNFNADFSGLQEFVLNGAGHTLRIGLRSGAEDTVQAQDNPTATTGTHTTLLAGSNEITASTLALGDQAGNSHGGTSVLRLGQANSINVDSISMGAGARSNASLNFRDGLTDPTVTIRAADGESAVANWDIGRVANYYASTWTADADFTGGELDALVGTLRIAIANPGTANTRQGEQVGTFTMERGVLDVGTLIIGDLSGTAGSSTATYGAYGTFNLGHENGLVKAGDVILANNTGSASGGTRNVSGTFNLSAGALEASTISRGLQDGTASSVTPNFNFSGGTVRNLAGGDLTISEVPVNLTGSGTRVFEATAGQTITIASDAVINGTGGFAKQGEGKLLLSAANTYTGATTVNAGTLAVDGSLTSAVTVNDGATLSGTGTFNNSVTLNSGATLSPGASPGTMTLGGDLTLDGADLAIDIWGSDNHDLITFSSGSLILSGSPTITVDLNGFDPALDNSYTIISGISDWSGEWGEVSVVNAPAEWGTKSFRIDQGSVMLTVIPEPNTLGLLLVIGAAAILRKLRMG